MTEEEASVIPEFIEIAPGRIIHRYQLAHAVHPSYRVATDFLMDPDTLPPVVYMAYMQFPVTDWKRPRVDFRYEHFRSQEAAEKAVANWIDREVGGYLEYLEENYGKEFTNGFESDPYKWWNENCGKVADYFRDEDNGPYMDNEFIFQVVEVCPNE